MKRVEYPWVTGKLPAPEVPENITDVEPREKRTSIDDSYFTTQGKWRSFNEDHPSLEYLQKYGAPPGHPLERIFPRNRTFIPSPININQHLNYLILEDNVIPDFTLYTKKHPAYQPFNDFLGKLAAECDSDYSQFYINVFGTDWTFFYKSKHERTVEERT